LDIASDRFLSANPHFCKSALSRYTQHDFIALVERHGIPYHEKLLGQLFCDGSARAIVAMLVEECRAAGVEIRPGCAVSRVSRLDAFRLETARGDVEASSLVLATGGLSIPKLGATGFAYAVARQFGLRVTETRPGLVPLRAEPADLAFMQGLSGVSLPAIAQCGRQSFREGLLFTHRGLSGPAILQISSYWRDGQPVRIDLLPDQHAQFLTARKRDRPKAALRTILAELMPNRLAQKLVETRLPDQVIGMISDQALARAASALKGWTVTPAGSEGYGKAEVTLGGVDTADLSSQTMAARAVPGLHVIGEAVDVTGWLGGYNFQWAWSSGWCAGQAA
jgi:predicted Rossmann fold flavoprotein